MRSTRQKLKLLRGISRANGNGGNGLTSRKSSNSNSGSHYNATSNPQHHTFPNHHRPSTGNGATTNGHINGDNPTFPQQHKHNHNQSNALTQHNTTTFYTTPTPHQQVNNNNQNGVNGGGRHPQYPAKAHNGTTPTVARAGAIRSVHTTAATPLGNGTPTLPASASIADGVAVTAFDLGSRENSVVVTPETITGEQGHAHGAESSSFQSNLLIPAPIGIGHPHRQWTQFLATNMECTGLNSDIREKAWSICRDYLHGAWKQIDSKDLIIKRVSGGLSNWLYHCSLPLSLTPQHNEPTQVLLRFYGQVHGEGALESLITESVIFTLLSERKLGPRLYGVFPGGRVEEFIPARPLQTVELRDPELSLLIAQKTAQIHGLNIPISKEPSWLWGTMDRWMANVRECLMKSPAMNDCKAEILQTLIDYNLEGELNWLKEFLPKVRSPVVFAHNDLQEGNILIRPEYETPDDKLALIDFEYCSYNYRGFDLANHFCEWSYNYNVESYPNFKFTPEDLPSLDEKLRYIRRYVQVLREEYRMNFSDADDEFLRTSELFDEEHIIREVDAFTLASHFFWSLWAIVNAQVSKIPFGYWEYGLCRLETYFILKKTFV